MSAANPHLVPFGPHSNCTLELCPLEHSVYRYRPSLVANGIFISLYSVAMAVHILLGIRWKTWWFMACMVTGCTGEIIGYIGRVLMWSNPFSFTAFMMQIVCVTTGPVYYSAAIYVTLAMTVTHLSRSTARFAPELLYYIFIGSDLLSLVLQAVGGGMSTSSSGKSQMAIDLALAGLSLQVFTLVIFAGLFVDYVFRFSRTAAAATALDVRMKCFLGALALATLLILARCAYRVDELSSGYSGPLVADEGLFIGLEGVLITVAAFVLCVGHPGFVFRKRAAKDAFSGEESGEAHVLREIE